MSSLQTCAISVIRIQYFKLSADVAWDNAASSYWSIGRLCSGIACACLCLPTLRPLIAEIRFTLSHQSAAKRSLVPRDGGSPNSISHCDAVTNTLNKSFHWVEREVQSAAALLAMHSTRSSDHRKGSDCGARLMSWRGPECLPWRPTRAEP
ncbi:uncharacterized protein B0T15DRAFT_516814 [Chaetomium strumarium]|uniref:Rhodopsin domain-containing protein n=1 Tax=Chaetomium strumarium TaxID=1170767 RepID=A0AAJ0H144_9PEZI|nr:hypothetical protein B0T15DRAFT_516814 [Chaetomium strumarium]